MEQRHNIEFIDVSRETFDEIEWYFYKYAPRYNIFADKILWWNNKVNLVSRNASKTIVLEHIRHSLAILTSEWFWSANIIYDIGTGAGLPGLAIEIAAPEKDIFLIDINGKKIGALKQIVFDVEAHPKGIINEDIYEFDFEPNALIVSKHAFKLNDIIGKYAFRNIKKFIFLKGPDFTEELDGIELTLNIKAHKLSTGTNLSFYSNKFMLEIETP